MVDSYLARCFKGQELYGDNFTTDQIIEWYAEEKEAYADLYSFEGKETAYPYHSINTHHCYRHLTADRLPAVLSIGGSYGEELLPIVHKIDRITILEPSSQLRAEALQGIPLHYVSPEVTGEMIFSDNSFDVVTCFGVLHHIPNVSKVMSEIHRVLKPGGHFIFREPIVSMGDWTKPRPGLTKNERGIPKHILDGIITQLNFRIINYGLCFTKPFDITVAKLLNINVYGSPTYVKVDAVLGKLIHPNYVYHPKNTLQKFRASCCACVLQKSGFD